MRLIWSSLSENILELFHGTFSLYSKGSTPLDRQNLWNFLKPAVDQQQNKFFKTVSCPTTAVLTAIMWSSDVFG